jgi:hypothetical protein
MLNVVAVIQGEAVTCCAFEAVMSEFLRLGIPADARFAPDIGDRLTEIGG